MSTNDSSACQLINTAKVHFHMLSGHNLGGRGTAPHPPGLAVTSSRIIPKWKGPIDPKVV